MASRICSRCSKVINPGDLLYRVTIKVFADFNGIINMKSHDIDVEKEFEKVKSVPEGLLEEEVYKEFDYILCPRCKEIYCANPLHLPLDNLPLSEDVP
jgi:hypothetical protein